MADVEVEGYENCFWFSLYEEGGGGGSLPANVAATELVRRCIMAEVK